MEVQSGKYQKCVDENGREYILSHDKESGFDLRFYYTNQENPQTLIMLREALISKMSKLTPEMLKDIASKNTSV